MQKIKINVRQVGSTKRNTLRARVFRITTGSNSCKNSVDITERRTHSWNKTTGVCHNCEESHLSEVGAFPRHIWTMNDLHAALFG